MAAVTIDDRALAYSVDADGRFVFEVDGQPYAFRQWTWGEKNRVTDAATSVDPQTGHVRLDLVQFNELMLATCLGGTWTPTQLRDLNPVLGDTLLAIAYWVNDLPETDKKRLASGAADPHAAPGPDDLPPVPGVRLDARPGQAAARLGHREVRADPRRTEPPVLTPASR